MIVTGKCYRVERLQDYGYDIAAIILDEEGEEVYTNSDTALEKDWRVGGKWINCIFEENLKKVLK